MINYHIAACQMNDLAYKGWNQAYPNYLFVGINEDTLQPSVADYWARVYLQTARSPQTRFAPTVTGNDQRVWTTSGVLFVSIFAPITAKGSKSRGRLLAETVQATLRSRPGCPDVRLENIRINELANDAKFYGWNVLANFAFDEKG